MRTLLALAALPAVAFAYSDTHPLLAWSSHSLPSTSTKASDLLGSLLESPDICSYDAVVMVSHVGLHATDLRSLPSSNPLARSLVAANHSVQYPYVTHADGSNPLIDIAEALAERCGTSSLSLSLEEDLLISGDATSEKLVVTTGLPSLEGMEGIQRMSAVDDHTSKLSSMLADLTATRPRHLVVYTGWSPSILARQLSPNPFASAQRPVKAFAPPQGGLLKRYQLLTPALLLGFIIAFGLLIPLLMFGIFALASIQSPVKNDPPKRWLSSEKKNQ